MKTTLILLASALTIAPAYARDLKADVSYEHGLWWEAPETPEVKITVADTLGNANTSAVTFRVTDDRNPDKVILNVQQKLNIAPGENQELVYTINIDEPGFYKCYVEDEGNKIKQFNIGYEPKQVTSLPNSKADFNKFWENALAELSSVAPEYQVTEDKEKSGSKRKAYAVSMKSLDGETIKGYLYVPIAKGKYPVQIYYNGYNAQPWEFDVDGRPDWIEYVSSVRGQMYSYPDNHFGDWIQYNIDNPESYYYKGAFMDVVRAIDFVSQLEKADTDLIFAEGGSQGGALTLVAASLDDRLAGIAPYIPFLTDYKDYFKIVNWPASAVFEAQKRANLTDEQLYDNLSYFDVKNFVRNIKCPVMMGIGLQDPTCPPHTNMSSYVLIESPKELIIYPTKGHTVDYSDWNPRRDEFFGNIIKTKKATRKDK